MTHSQIEVKDSVMGTREQLTEALALTLEPGEEITGWRAVVANAKVENASYQTSLALLGPSAFRGATNGTVTSSGQVPPRTNLVVATDRRLLWCNKARFTNEVVVGGSDQLETVVSVDITPARIALAKLRIIFHDGSVVQLDLPTDHKAHDFALGVTGLLSRVPVAA